MKRILHIVGSVVMCCMLLLTSSCITYYFVSTSLWRHGRNNLWKVNEGGESEDLHRFAEWLSKREGRLSIEKGSTIQWFETQSYRCYSNDTFVLAFCPPRFSEKYADIVWLAGKLDKSEDIISDFFPPSILDEHNIRTYTYPKSVLPGPEKCVEDGIYTIRFGDQRENLCNRLLYLDSLSPLKTVLKDESTGNERLYVEYLLGEGQKYYSNSFHLAGPYAMDKYNGHVWCSLTVDGKVFQMQVSIFNSRFGVPDMNAYKYRKLPILRSGSFKVDWETPEIVKWEFEKQ